jgi:hypothetical protein
VPKFPIAVEIRDAAILRIRQHEVDTDQRSGQAHQQFGIRYAKFSMGRVEPSHPCDRSLVRKSSDPRVISCSESYISRILQCEIP